MPVFEHCAECGELRFEHYGTVNEDKCVDCAAAERHTSADTSGTDTNAAGHDRAAGRIGYALVDHRQQVRIRTLISGYVEDQNYSHGFDVVDISKTGAKLRSTEGLPNGTLTLAFPGAGTLRATPVWRDGFTRGLKFVEPRDRIIAVIGKAMPHLGPMLRAA